MTYKLTINRRLPGINEMIEANRVDRHAGNRMKQQSQDSIRLYILRDLRNVKITKPVRLHYRFYEPNRCRDLDNISGFAHKVVQDTLVASGVLANDGWANIVGMQDDFYVDSKSPRIEVEISEVDEVGKIPI